MCSLEQILSLTLIIALHCVTIEYNACVIKATHLSPKNTITVNLVAPISRIVIPTVTSLSCEVLSLKASTYRAVVHGDCTKCRLCLHLVEAHRQADRQAVSQTTYPCSGRAELQPMRDVRLSRARKSMTCLCFKLPYDGSAVSSNTQRLRVCVGAIVSFG